MTRAQRANDRDPEAAQNPEILHMPDPSHHPILTRIEDFLWSGSGFESRSKELTPIYVDRFNGPRIAGKRKSHDFWEMGVVIEGSGELHAHEILSLRKSVTFIIPPGVGHTESATGNIDMIWIGLRGSLLERQKFDRIRWAANPMLENSIENLWLTAIGHRGGIGAELDGMSRCIVSRFFRILAEENTPERTSKVATSVGFMRKHMQEPLTVSMLANHSGCSEGHFRRMFKDRTGMTPTHFLSRLRIQHAMRLLEHSNLPIAEVSRESGYPDSFYFCRVFQKFTGCSPLAYRKSIRPGD